MNRLIALSTLLLFGATSLANDNDLKTINYRGGLVTFRIPTHWVEEYEPDGGGTFYENVPNTGTLRLSVITLKAPPSKTGNLATNALAGMSDVDPSKIRLLKTNLALAQYIKHSSENGQNITLYWWHLASEGEAGVVRVANYSYTILTKQENDKNILQELSVVQHEIENASIYSGPHANLSGRGDS
jgi:hypothetical protein